MNYFTFAIITTLLLVSSYAYMVYIMIGVKRRYTQPVVHLITAIGFGVFATVAMLFYTALEMSENELHYEFETAGKLSTTQYNELGQILRDVEEDVFALQYDFDALDASSDIKFKAIIDDLATHERIMRQHKHQIYHLDENVSNWARGIEDNIENLALDVLGTKHN